MDTEDKRRSIKDKMAQTRLDLDHTQACTLLPDREFPLDRMQQNARVAEIGVAFGDFTKEIIKRCKPEKLFLIDSWATQRYRSGLKQIEEDFNALILGEKVVIMQGLSTDVLGTFGPDELDWAYIDTNHSYDTTIQELQLCDTIVGVNGRIAGHDFCTGNVIKPVPYGVVEAVTKFCKDNDWRFEYLTVESRGHFSFCLMRL